MYRRDYADVIAGLLLTLGGAFVVWYAASHYRMGTLHRMGPGMFPISIGGLITVLGLSLAVLAWFRPGQRREKINWRALIFVLLGVLAFTVLITPFGLIPAVVAVISLSSLAERRVHPQSLLILNVIMCVIAVLIFKVGLGMNFAIINWPFQ